MSFSAIWLKASSDQPLLRRYKSRALLSKSTQILSKWLIFTSINEPRCKQTEYRIGSAAEPKASDCSLFSSLKSDGKSTPIRLNIPDIPLADGKSFYDYLGAFLYSCYRDKKGNWISGGRITDTDNTRTGKWYSLRMQLNPNHNYVLAKPRNGEHYNHSEVTKLLRTSSNRLTGQRVHPHLLRGIFATWFLD